MENSKTLPEPKTLNVGCGRMNRFANHIDMDIDIGVLPTVVGDIVNLPFKDDVFENVVAIHVLEHIRDIVQAVDECWRVLKKDGVFVIGVPRYPHSNAIADPTHVRFFVEETFGYFVRKNSMRGQKHHFDPDKSKIMANDNTHELLGRLVK